MRIQSHLDRGVNLRPNQRRAASALAGGEALARLAEDPRALEIARGERLGPALSRAATRDGLAGAAVDGWRSELRASAATRIWLAAAAGELVARLSDAGTAFAPIKGWDLGRRVYPSPEERPTSDLDLLLSPQQLDPALSALKAAGFRPLMVGRRAESYLREEGYAAAWKAPAGQLVELHFRLWGSAPRDLAAAILAAADPDPGLGRTALAIRPEHAFILAAFHIFLDGPPRPAGAFRDLAMIAAQGIDAAFLEEESLRFGLPLPVALASAAAGELFANPNCARLAAALRPLLRWPERRLAWDADLDSRRIFLARWLAGRPSRHGWRLFWRRLWPHAGIVEAATDDGRAWPRRRLWYQWNHWRGKTGPGDPR